MTVAQRRGSLVVPGILVFVMFLVVTNTNVLPFRQIIAQNRQVEETRAELEMLVEENERLARQTAVLQTPSEIERIAREDFGYVRPRDTSYVIVEPGGRPVITAEPVEVIEPSSRGFFGSIWDYLTGRDLEFDG